MEATQQEASPGLKDISSPPSKADIDVEDPAGSKRVLELLTKHGAKFRTLEHAPTKTSQESADVRGVALASGAKAMLLKSGKALPHGGLYVLAVLSAEKQADLKKLKSILGTNRLSMAAVEDVKALTGCIPGEGGLRVLELQQRIRRHLIMDAITATTYSAGAVPPFGSLFPGTLTIMDVSLQNQGPDINFNAGLRTLSVLGLAVEQYLAIEKPQVAEFSS